jgi:hypothetical protein
VRRLECALDTPAHYSGYVGTGSMDR